MLQLILRFMGLIENCASAAASFAAAVLPSSALYYSNHHCHLEIKRRTALPGASREFKYIYDGKIKSFHLQKATSTLQKSTESVVYMRFRTLHSGVVLFMICSSSFNNLDLIADKPPWRRFIGACKLFEGLPVEGSLSCVCVVLFFLFCLSDSDALKSHFSFKLFTSAD